MYKKKYSGWLKHADFLILDIIVLQLSFYVAYCIRHIYCFYTNFHTASFHRRVWSIQCI